MSLKCTTGHCLSYGTEYEILYFIKTKFWNRVYSYSPVLPDRFLFKLINFNLIKKETYQKENEYMTIHPPINVLAVWPCLREETGASEENLPLRHQSLQKYPTKYMHGKS